MLQNRFWIVIIINRENIMKYYKHLYISENLEKKKDKIIRKLNRNKLQLSVHLITLPEGDKNQLEIIDSQILLQPSYPKKDLFVVGIVSGYDEALEYVEKMAQEAYENTNRVDIRNYILKKEQED